MVRDCSTLHVSLFILNQHHEEHPGVILHSQFRPTHPFQMKCMDPVCTVVFIGFKFRVSKIFILFFKRILLFSNAALQYIDQ